jgi:hypothetical protein
MKFAFTDETNLSAAIAYYDLGVEGRVGTYRPNEFYGNSSVINDQGDEVYEYDFALYNAGVQLNTSLFDMPLSLFGDYVYNDDASDFDTGYIAGFSTGMGNVSFLYWYQKLEANAVLGAWTDSDFAGGGGFYDLSNWDEVFWDSEEISSVAGSLAGNGKNISFLFYGNSVYTRPFTIQTIQIEYIPRRLNSGK